MKPTVHVVDDEPSITRYLYRLLDHRGFRVVTYASAEEVLRREAPEGPGCLILDVFLPGLSGLDLQQIISDDRDHLSVIFISGQGDIPMSVRAMRAGATDFLTKPLDAEILVSAVERAIEQSERIWAEREESVAVQDRARTLSRRQAEVLRLVALGKLNKQIAAELHIVEKTVKVHRGLAMRKLGVRSVAELVRLAHKADLFQSANYA